VRALHPALDLWMIVDGYGKTLSRPGLDLRHREFCSVGMLMPQRVPRQLVAHLRGALNAGASAAELDEVLAIAASMDLEAEVLEIARNLWQELRDTLLHD
jgi:alkylhydroperoxidase/carboxymuconolactone decarboxylase family protein YurZ